MPALGTEIASKIMTSMITPAPGTAAVPIDANTAVRTIVNWAPKPRSIPIV